MSKTVLDDFVPEITDHFFRKCNPGWHLLPYPVNDYNIVYIIKGNATYTINGSPHEAAAGDLICLSEGDLAEAVTSSHNPMQHYDVSFSKKYHNAKKIGGGGGGGGLTSAPLFLVVGGGRDFTDRAGT
jgi:hypothetical protein